jgi:phosphoribosylanthranilate isomerase
MRTWVKICGVTRVEDALVSFEHGADAIGLNFWPGSKRFCSVDRARAIVSAVGPGALVFGVFVRASREEIARTVREVGLTGVQLHGGEPLAEAEGWDLPVIRAVGASSRAVVALALAEADVRQQTAPATFEKDAAHAAVEKDAAAAAVEKDAAPAAVERDAAHAAVPKEAAPAGASPRWSGHRLLLDNASGGGSGVEVEASVLEGFDLRGTVVAGGLTADNVAAIVRRLSPFGVDTAGGVEASPGIKDAHRIEAFVREARRG